MQKETNKSEHKKITAKEKRLKIVQIAIPVLLLFLVVVSAYKLIFIQLSYREANDEYEALMEDYAEGTGNTGKMVVIQSGVTENNDNRIERDENFSDYPSMYINFEALSEINTDFRAWIRVPVLDISYPVVRADDNEHYLNYTFEGKWNGAGCLFIDYENSDDLSDYNTYIYGHNMRNGSMFGSLKRFRSEPGLCASNPYFYLYTPDAVYQYEIFAYYRTEYDSDRFMLVNTEDDYDYYIESAIRYSEYTPAEAIDFTTRPNIITLSTCSGNSGTKRFVVHGALTATYAYDDK